MKESVFNKIPKQRLWLYLMLVGLIPIIISWCMFSNKLDSVNMLQHQVWSLQEQAYNREKKQTANMAVLHHFRDADHFYIDKNLETLVLLEPELESLRKILNQSDFPPDEPMKKRIDFLSGPGNNMVFTEGIVQSTPLFQEVTETLAHPVEIDIANLQHILCLVEGVSFGDCTPPPNRPQLIILDFKIEKKNVSEKNEVFLLNLKLLKREFL